MTVVTGDGRRRRGGTAMGAVGAALVALWLAGEPASAATDAERVNRDIDGVLQMLAGNGPDKLLTHGAIEVKRAGFEFDVRIADVELIPDQETRIDVGTVRLHLRAKEDGVYEISDVRLPAELPWTGSQDAKGKIALPSQHVSAIWSTPMQAFLSFDVAYQDVLAINPEDASEIKVAGLTLKGDSHEAAPDRWDFTWAYGVKGLEGKMPDGSLSIAAVDIDSTLRGLRLSQYQAIARKLEMPATSGGLPIEALRDAIAIASASEIKAVVKGILVRDPTGAEMLSLDEAGIELGGIGLDSPTSTVDIGLRENGLRLSLDEGEGNPLMQGLAPRRLAIAVSLEDLPWRALWNTTLDAFGSGEGDPLQAIEAMAEQLPIVAQQLMEQAGSKLRLKQWQIETPTVSATIDGLVQATAAAGLGASGEITVELRGLHDLVAKAEAVEADPEFMSYLGMLQAMADHQVAGDGAQVERYVVTLSPEGQILVNGRDVMAQSPMSPPGVEEPPSETTEPPQDLQELPPDTQGDLPGPKYDTAPDGSEPS